MEKEEIKRITPMKEWRLLVRQCILILWSDKKNLAVMMLFPVMAALVTVWIAGENMFAHYDGTKSASFVLVSAAIWGGLFNSIQSVVKERDNIKRDYITGLRIWCYSTSRAVVQLLLCVIQSLVLCLSIPGVMLVYGNEIPKHGLIFNSAMPEYYLSLLFLMYAADMMGFMISCLVRKTETANVIAPYILIVQLIFSGVLFEIKGGAKLVSNLMVSRWGMEALGSISNLNDMKLKIQLTVPDVPHEYQNMFDATQNHLFSVWGILVLFSLIFLVTGNYLLHRVSKDTR